jgi:hypothetical protein
MTYDHIEDDILVCTTCSEVMLHWQKPNHESKGCN